MDTTDPPLNPAQQRVVDGLMARGEERPAFDPMLPAQLLDQLESGLAPVAERLGRGEIVANKTALAQVLTCERYRQAEEREGFTWSARRAAGTVAHKAIELSVFARDPASPLESVDRAIDRLASAAEPWGPGSYLAGMDAGEMAELRAAATERVTAFADTFPPLKKEWRPVVEARSRVDLCESRIVLKGKVDLSIGRRQPPLARVLLVDFKTGSPHHTHADDLRFYALLETIRMGVPPFRVASYYLEAARWHHEDVTDDLLRSTAHRVVQGVTKLVELQVDGREAAISPGPACRGCSDRHDCPGARMWEERAEELALSS